MLSVKRSCVSLILSYSVNLVFLFDEMWGILLFFMFAVSRETANICLPFIGYSSEAIVCLVGKKREESSWGCSVVEKKQKMFP